MMKIFMMMRVSESILMTMMKPMMFRDESKRADGFVDQSKRKEKSFICHFYFISSTTDDYLHRRK